MKTEAKADTAAPENKSETASTTVPKTEGEIAVPAAKAPVGL